MSECIFCKIRDRSIPADIVYEDELLLAFMDIAPIHPGHVLIAPKAHTQTAFDTGDDTLARMIATAKKIGMAVMQATKCQGINIGVNNYAAAGQIVHHVHMHVIPRHEGDGLKSWPHGTYKEGEMKTWAEKIAREMKNLGLKAKAYMEKKEHEQR